MKEKVPISDESGTLMTVANIYGGNTELKMDSAYPIAIFHGDKLDRMHCYPIFDGHAHNNLYGRLMTIIEAIIEDEKRQKAVKDIVSKELRSFGDALKESASEVANGGDSGQNIYSK